MKKVAVLLAGNGVYDGAEINEAILTLLHIAKNGATYQCFAPDVEQLHTINHLTGEEMNEKRNVLVEAARIARGDIKALNHLNIDEFDALIVPGGFGAAKNLCDFAVKGAQATINSDVLNACKKFATANKPAGYMCIAPALIPFIYDNAKLTIGNDNDTAAALTSLGATHLNCDVDDVVIDQHNKIVTTPAYMLAQSIIEADAGIAKLVNRVLEIN
ncbi:MULTISPECIES: isoprenoid biosynthesis glyoxalase ElbB [unclassified Pseudoalteromonas]|uniref:isoprenoid biosynthesis glyoxalase ElbB n=1 Tax=unclassified Pseudoalteromonas TaxID=194690 RepID=UPI001108A376|nr:MULTISPECIES: isoprenoid biosynthesis glyoxalase ElbB [unclassified Pseudoalteromonas]MBW4967020.1 isoprenoid biosynthesis glyoxalase ElbB [Pseudoalteromonas sp. CR1]TMN78022.1 isoprenoid biosynthesis protein ElbB [Pseudoalteromonas sp. S410]TMN89178.1 isoprenoid biosynthesis protein ElbB [Pseudoalteromonas sp. S408]TMN95925.1 isoprenoid biosynthesis protein ElbB [Pseudoalteromonas sp. S409]TMN99080.1 isoprenoid biosynthesis protein ElbB [Pseudoalteromonas sp. S407]